MRDVRKSGRRSSGRGPAPSEPAPRSETSTGVFGADCTGEPFRAGDPDASATTPDHRPWWAGSRARAHDSGTCSSTTAQRIGCRRGGAGRGRRRVRSTCSRWPSSEVTTIRHCAPGAPSATSRASAGSTDPQPAVSAGMASRPSRWRGGAGARRAASRTCALPPVRRARWAARARSAAPRRAPARPARPGPGRAGSAAGPPASGPASGPSFGPSSGSLSGPASSGPEEPSSRRRDQDPEDRRRSRARGATPGAPRRAASSRPG